MSLNIEHYPNKSFQVSFLFFPLPKFTIDLNQSVKEKLGENQELTNSLALKIFKEIKLKSDILSFLTKPIVLIPLSFAVLAASFALPATGIVALKVIGLIAWALGCCILGFAIREPDYLSQLSRAHSDQSKRAAEYIQNLESSNHEFVFTV